MDSRHSRVSHPHDLAQLRNHKLNGVVSITNVRALLFDTFGTVVDWRED